MLDVLIVGAGPVGLHLAALLLQEGVTVRVLEQRRTPGTTSRAIGIHPPGLAALARAGVAEPLLAEGVRITRGVARAGGREVAGLRFDSPHAAYPFILALPQVRTEAWLLARVQALDPDAVLRGRRVVDLHDDGTSVTLTTTPAASPAGTAGTASPRAPASPSPPGPALTPPAERFTARLVVAADGARSTVRGLLGLPTRERHFPDTFLMGDFPDTGLDGPLAVLHLEPGGIVESFPLPGGLRRWVAHTPVFVQQPTAKALGALVHERTGIALDPAGNSMLSAFTVRSRLARRWAAGRTVLIGDAAHEISPIGGQGMSLGWLDAVALAPLLLESLRGGASSVGGALEPTALAAFEHRRRAAAQRAAWQAALNMRLGRAGNPQLLAARNAGARTLLRVPGVAPLVARRFSMGV